METWGECLPSITQLISRPGRSLLKHYPSISSSQKNNVPCLTFPRLSFYQKRLPILAFKPPAIKSARGSLAPENCRLNCYLEGREQTSRKLFQRQSQGKGQEETGRRLHVSRVCAGHTQVPRGGKRLKRPCEGCGRSPGFGAEHVGSDPSSTTQQLCELRQVP